MRQLLLILALTASVAGCVSPLTVPPAPVAPTDYSGYFWQPGTYTYQSPTATHTLTVTGSGNAFTISDKSSLGPTSSVTVGVNNNQFNLTGLSPGDLFGFDNSIQFVMDTNVAVVPPIAVRSIASLGGMLFAASDSYLYEYDLKKDTLLQRSTLPAGMTLYGDEVNGLLYAVNFGGSDIWSSNDDGKTWPNKYTIGGAGISAVTADDPNDDGDKDLLWVGSGTDLYRITLGSMVPTKEPSYPNPIVALDHLQQKSIVVGLSNGDVVDVQHHGGGPGNPRNVPGGLKYLAGGFAGSGTGVFALTAPPFQLAPGAVSTLYETPAGVYGGVGMDFWLFQGILPGQTFKNLGPSLIHPVGQVATISSPLDTAIFVLAGDSMYRYKYISPTAVNWVTVNQKAGSAPAPNPGAFTLLSNTAPWSAGYLIQRTGGARQTFVDSVQLVTYAQQVVLDSVTYNDVIIFKFTAYSGTAANTTNVPQYVIYFERGKGPIRIEKMLGTTTEITRLVK